MEFIEKNEKVFNEYIARNSSRGVQPSILSVNSSFYDCIYFENNEKYETSLNYS